jgi:hypothetical protein
VREITGDSATLLPRPSESTTRQMRFIGMDFRCLVHFVIRPLLDAWHPPIVAPPHQLLPLLALPVPTAQDRWDIMDLVFDLTHLGIRGAFMNQLVAEGASFFVETDSIGFKLNITRPFVVGQAVPQVSFHRDSRMRATTDYQALLQSPQGVIIDMTRPSFGFAPPPAGIPPPLINNNLHECTVISHDHGNVVVDDTVDHDFIAGRILNAAFPPPGGIGPVHNEQSGLKVTGTFYRQVNGSTWIQHRDERIRETNGFEFINACFAFLSSNAPGSIVQPGDHVIPRNDLQQNFYFHLLFLARDQYVLLSLTLSRGTLGIHYGHRSYPRARQTAFMHRQRAEDMLVHLQEGLISFEEFRRLQVKIHKGDKRSRRRMRDYRDQPRIEMDPDVIHVDGDGRFGHSRYHAPVPHQRLVEVRSRKHRRSLRMGEENTSINCIVPHSFYETGVWPAGIAQPINHLVADLIVVQPTWCFEHVKKTRTIPAPPLMINNSRQFCKIDTDPVVLLPLHNCMALNGLGVVTVLRVKTCNNPACLVLFGMAGPIHMHRDDVGSGGIRIVTYHGWNNLPIPIPGHPLFGFLARPAGY